MAQRRLHPNEPLAGSVGDPGGSVADGVLARVRAARSSLQELNDEYDRYISDLSNLRQGIFELREQHLRLVEQQMQEVGAVIRQEATNAATYSRSSTDRETLGVSIGCH